ncbi:unnamed protein product [Allacma fusca]|uniref:Uncharacterized protein n=1 Tax=Allacma fusca TaxID=39272 RepID=A0A8J2JQT8_9HEXA|nr:unnamed protein product [Allacma fusca]
MVPSNRRKLDPPISQSHDSTYRKLQQIASKIIAIVRSALDTAKGTVKYVGFSSSCKFVKFVTITTHLDSETPSTSLGSELRCVFLYPAKLKMVVYQICIPLLTRNDHSIQFLAK